MIICPHCKHKETPLKGETFYAGLWHMCFECGGLCVYVDHKTAKGFGLRRATKEEYESIRNTPEWLTWSAWRVEMKAKRDRYAAIISRGAKGGKGARKLKGA
jgi:hypothetical protein